MGAKNCVVKADLYMTDIKNNKVRRQSKPLKPQKMIQDLDTEARNDSVESNDEHSSHSFSFEDIEDGFVYVAASNKSRPAMFVKKPKKEQRDSLVLVQSKVIRNSLTQLMEEEKVEEEENNVCEICLDVLFTKEQDNQILVLNSCNDIYHFECLKTYISTQIDSAAFPITCPSPQCRAHMHTDDL